MTALELMETSLQTRTNSVEEEYNFIMQMLLLTSKHLYGKPIYFYPRDIFPENEKRLNKEDYYVKQCSLLGHSSYCIVPQHSIDDYRRMLDTTATTNATDTTPASQQSQLPQETKAGAPTYTTVVPPTEETSGASASSPAQEETDVQAELLKNMALLVSALHDTEAILRLCYEKFCETNS